MELKTKYSPLYMIITNSTVTLKKISVIKTLLHTKVHWEVHQNKKRITQCRRCQGWGHATTNCFSTPRCVKCAQNHFSHECLAPAEQEPKCANCNGAHTAANSVCPVYQYKLQKRNASDENQRQMSENLQQTADRHQSSHHPPAPHTERYEEYPQLRATATRAAYSGHARTDIVSYESATTSQADRITTTATMPRTSSIHNNTTSYANAVETAQARPGASNTTNIKGNVITTVPPHHLNPSSSDNFCELMNALKATKQLINNTEIIRAVKDYNSILQKCGNDKNGKFWATIQFAENINLYDI